MITIKLHEIFVIINIISCKTNNKIPLHIIYLIISSLLMLGYSNIELVWMILIERCAGGSFIGSWVNRGGFEKKLISSAFFLFNSSKNSSLTLFPINDEAFFF